MSPGRLLSTSRLGSCVAVDCDGSVAVAPSVLDVHPKLQRRAPVALDDDTGRGSQHLRQERRELWPPVGRSPVGRVDEDEIVFLRAIACAPESRESASMPSAPVPAKRSSTVAPSSSPSIANSASLTRSEVGRVALPRGA